MHQLVRCRSHCATKRATITDTTLSLHFWKIILYIIQEHSTQPRPRCVFVVFGFSSDCILNLKIKSHHVFAILADDGLERLVNGVRAVNIVQSGLVGQTNIQPNVETAGTIGEVLAYVIQSQPTYRAPRPSVSRKNEPNSTEITPGIVRRLLAAS